MHELSVAQNILEITRQYIPENFKGINIRIRIQIGAFRNILPELLEFGFKVLTKGTDLELSSLVIDYIPLTVRCNECGGISEIEPSFFFCSHCSCNNVEINTGNELQVKEIEFLDNIEEPL